MGYFDGASQQKDTNFGVGGVLYLRDSSQLQWIINIGSGSNTKGELVGLWALLYLSRRMGINQL